MLAGLLTVSALVIPAGVYLVARPQDSVPSARLRSAIVLLGAAFIWASAIHSEPTSGTFVLQLVCGAILVVTAVAILVTGRRSPPS